MKNRKIILHLITSVGNGGAEKNLFRLCVLDKKNQNIIITLKKNSFYLQLLKDHGISVVDLNFLRNPFSGLKKLTNIIKKKKPDILMSWMYHSCFITALINKLISKKIVKIWNIRHSSVIFFKTKIFTYFLSKYFLSFFSKIPDKIIYNSYYSKKTHKLYGYNKYNACVVHNGFIKKSFKKKKISDRISFGFIGRYSPQKNFDFLFEIIKFLKTKKINFVFYLVGADVINNTEILKKIDHYKIKDKIIFLKTKNDISNYFNLIDITLSTSIYGESFPNILAESLMSSTPCLAVNFGENKLILKKGGFTFKKNDLSDFYSKFKKINLLRKNKKKWDKFRKEGHKYVYKNFPVSKMLSKYYQIYNN